MDILSLVRLMQFGDSMLPTGAFAFSGALEAAAQSGVVHDAATLQQYVAAALRQASTGDAVGLAFALRDAGVSLLRVHERDEDLEGYFLNLVGGEKC